MQDTVQYCAECGLELSDSDLGQQCPHCLLRLALTEAADEPEAPGLASPYPLGSRFFGDYELLEEIARGGMGVVWKARQLSLGRVVALKMIHATLLGSPEARLRFRLEIEAVAHLNHAHIVPLLETGEHRGVHYFSMPLIAGGSLSRNNLRLGLKGIARLMIQVARAVHHAHQHGVLHRDLKPSNILLDQAGDPYIADFGLAKLLTGTSRITFSESTMGSPNYMPPEQAAGDPQLTTAADIYSLGAVLYELLTGQPPFHGPTPLETLRQVTESEPIAPRKVNPKVHRDLETICLKCLQKDPATRYTSAEEFAQDLERWIAGHPVHARPVSSIEQVWRWCRRQPALAAALALSIVLLVVLAVGSTVAAWRIDAANKRTARLLTRIQLQRAEDHFTGDETSKGLALLANVLRREPDNDIAAARLVSALGQRRFALPDSGPMGHRTRVLTARLYPERREVLGVAEGGTVCAFRVGSGEHINRLMDTGLDFVAAQFTPDGKWILGAHKNAVAKVYDARTGRPLGESMEHPSPITLVECDPTGKSMLTVAGNQARVWEVPSAIASAPWLSHEEPIRKARWIASGSQIVTVSENCARIWEASSGKLTREVPLSSAKITALAVSADGGRMAVAVDDGTAHIFDITGRDFSGDPIAFVKHEGPINDLEFDPTGRLLASASWDQTARLWDAASGQPYTAPLRHRHTVWSVQFSSDGSSLVTASQDTTARLWDVASGKPLSESMPHLDGVTDAFIVDEGRRVLTISWGNRVSLWQLPSELRYPAGSKPHHAVIYDASFSPDGKRIISASADRTGVIWDAQTVRSTATMKHQGGVRFARFAPDNQRVITASDDGTARVWDAQMGEPIGTPMRHAGWIRSAAFSRDAMRVVTASHDRTARVWDASTGKPITDPMSHEAPVASACFSPDGRLIVTALQGFSAHLWDANIAKQICPPLKHFSWVEAAEFSPDGQFVLTASRDTRARIWDLAGHQRTVLKHAGEINAASFSPNGRKVVTASADFTARVWDARTGAPITEPLTHHNAVTHAEFSPDGRRIATASRDGSARVWDAATGQPLTEPFRHNATVNRARFSPDGRSLVTCSADQSVRVWPLPNVRTPVPGWLPQLAESLAGHRFTGVNEFTPLIKNDFYDISRQLDAPANAGHLGFLLKQLSYSNPAE